MFPFCEDSSQTNHRNEQGPGDSQPLQRNLKNNFSRNWGRTQALSVKHARSKLASLRFRFQYSCQVAMAQQWGGTGGQSRGQAHQASEAGLGASAGPTQDEQQRQQCRWQMHQCKLSFTEQIRSYTEDNKCCISHCQRQYSQRATRCCVRTDGIIMNPWFYNIHKRHRNFHRCVYMHICVCLCVCIYILYPQTGYHFQLQKWRATLELSWIPSSIRMLVNTKMPIFL